MDIATIIEQGRGEKSLTDFARELGLSHSILSMIRHGHRRAGVKTIKALLSHPDTRGAMLSYLSQNVTPINTGSDGGNGE